MINISKWKYLPKSILKEIQGLLDELVKRDSHIKKLEAELALIRQKYNE